MSDTAVKVENLWKQYRLGAISHNTLKKDLQSWWARVRGQEDPNAKLFMTQTEGSGGEDCFWALRDVSFEVKHGEAVGIIGRNGAGKSTLLKILSRITVPSRGQSIINGRVASLLEVGTGFHPELTGRENIFLNGAILGMNKEEVRRKFDAIVAFTEIEKFIDTPVKRYSSGMYIRLAFGIAAHLEPDILIVDEALAVGDVQFQKKCLGKMEDVGKEGRTVLFVSHNMQAVRQFCRSSILLDNGGIAMIGQSSDVIKHYIEQSDINNLNELANEMDAINKIANDPAFKLSDIELRQGSKVTGSIDAGEELAIIITYELLQKIYGFHVYFQIFDSEGTMLIETISNGDSDELPVSHPGRYRSTVAIPADFFSPARYEFRFFAGIHNIRQCIPRPIKFVLDVKPTGRVNRAYPGYVSPARLCPLFAWETTKV